MKDCCTKDNSETIYIGSTFSFIFLEKATVLEIVLDNDIRDSVEDKLHIVGVCGTSEVGVDLLGVLFLVQILKLKLDVGSRLLIGVGSC